MPETETQEQYLYRVEAELEGGSLLTVVVVSSSDEKAFTFAENHLLRHTIAPPKTKELSIVEKKPLGRNGVGYVIETTV